ncbi:hypothetical protein CSC17_1465 [Klebsiella oxytoca]|nr:hypothetical protein CSC17_1465 [Klebsiella oxytoca]
MCKDKFDMQTSGLISLGLVSERFRYEENIRFVGLSGV